MSTLTKKYRLWILAVVCVTLYILAGEVADRFIEIIDRYGELQKKESMIMTPEEYLRKKHTLERQKRDLMRTIESAVPHQTEGPKASSIGVFDYVSTHAKASGISLKALTPKEEHPSGSGVDAAFSVLAQAKYHDAARFINLIETGDVPVVILQLTIQQNAGQAENPQMLDIALEGRAHLSKQLQ